MVIALALRASGASRRRLVSERAEKNCCFLNSGPADVAAGLVVHEPGCRVNAGALVQQADRLHPVSAVVIEGVTVKVIRAAAGDHGNLGAAIAAEFGGIG